MGPVVIIPTRGAEVHSTERWEGQPFSEGNILAFVLPRGCGYGRRDQDGWKVAQAVPGSTLQRNRYRPDYVSQSRPEL